ncbi:MAG TPA: hypothetical protein VHC63_04025 [Acidimicrobiales bacterium]|nr:hypothetical protein [Acidimicrobiales bacterium]
MGALGDAWQADAAFEALHHPDIEVPRGFRPFGFGRTAWRNDFADTSHRALSLVAESSDLSGLAQLASHALWKLVCIDERTTDDDFDHVVRFESLEELDLSKTRVGDRSATAIHTLQKLRWLSVASTRITDAAMEHFAGLRALEHLDVCDTAVTDEGLRALAFHPALRVINVRGSHVTGEALAPLLTLPNLRQVWMTRGQHHHARHFAHERPEVDILS